MAFAEHRTLPVISATCVTHRRVPPDVDDRIHSIMDCKYVHAEFFPNGIEQFGCVGTHCTMVRHEYFDPPWVVSTEFPIDNGHDFAFVNKDVVHIQITVGQDIRCSVWKIFL